MSRKRQDRFTGVLIVRTVTVLMTVLSSNSNMRGDAATWNVGDDSGTWTIPATSNDLNYTAWAESRNFRFGDELFFSYSTSLHSVLLVNASSYETCLLVDPIGTYTSGEDTITLDTPGVRDYYFVCGTSTMCFLDQKLHVTLVGDVPDGPPSPTLTTPSPSGAPSSPSHARRTLVSTLIIISMRAFLWLR